MERQKRTETKQKVSEILCGVGTFCRAVGVGCMGGSLVLLSCGIVRSKDGI